MSENYYSPEEVAVKLKLAKSTIWRYIRNGRLKATKLNCRNFRISDSQLNEFLGA